MCPAQWNLSKTAFREQKQFHELDELFAVKRLDLFRIRFENHAGILSC